jgi:hypothetical protein
MAAFNVERAPSRPFGCWDFEAIAAGLWVLGDGGSEDEAEADGKSWFSARGRKGSSKPHKLARMSTTDSHTSLSECTRFRITSYWAPLSMQPLLNVYRDLVYVGLPQ